MFDYFDEKSKFRLKVQIGQYISQKIFDASNYKNRLLVSFDEINSINRMSLAEQFIASRTRNGKYPIDSSFIKVKDYEMFELENDIAEFMDFRIVYQYWHRKYELENPDINRHSINHLYPGIEHLDGLKYIYAANYEREREYIYLLNNSYATVKKLCPECGRILVVKTSRYGKFYGCSGYPSCHHKEKYKND